MKSVCAKAKVLGPVDASAARRFLEANFSAELSLNSGLLTGYFSPEYEARLQPDPAFSAPLRARPDDLIVLELAAFDASLSGKRIVGRVQQGRFEPYPNRQQIETQGLGRPLLWMKPSDLFFLQIQGSGTALLPAGERRKLVYEAANGRPFVGIAKTLRDRGLLPDNGTSGEAIQAWLIAHQGPEAEAVMWTNPRYVYFSVGTDDGQEPLGAAGKPLSPGRAIAVDPAYHDYGDLFWIEAGAPALTGSFPAYRRLVAALDTGGAIKGEVRADLYFGRGAGPGLEAGRVRHALRLYRLRPIALSAPVPEAF
jgi:membrane-bound lytic murein transglycosylase A